MIGCDIIEIDRIWKSYEKFGYSFVKRILSDNEYEEFIKRKKSKFFLSGRFAAKEAVAKCLKTGIGSVGFRDIEIISGQRGEPVVYLNRKKVAIEVTISHSKNIAMAVAFDNRGDK